MCTLYTSLLLILLNTVLLPFNQSNVVVDQSVNRSRFISHPIFQSARAHLLSFHRQQNPTFFPPWHHARRPTNIPKTHKKASTKRNQWNHILNSWKPGRDLSKHLKGRFRAVCLLSQLHRTPGSHPASRA